MKRVYRVLFSDAYRSAVVVRDKIWDMYLTSEDSGAFEAYETACVAVKEMFDDLVNDPTF